MKNRLIIFILFLSAGIIWAQKNSFTGIPADNVIHNYLTEVQTYATLYSGKTETPYDTPFANHPYFETAGYIKGELGYNQVVYHDVLMRIDLFRDEITVVYPNTPYRIVLNNEKFNYAVLNGSTIVKSMDEKSSKVKFTVLLHDGTFPVVRKYKMIIASQESDRRYTSSFRIQHQYEIYIAGIPYSVKNKNSILKLFPDKRKELNEFAKQHKLDFKNRIEQSIIALVNHYETMNNEQ
jgi:hypothetical protein